MMTRRRILLSLFVLLLPLAAYGQDTGEEFLAAARKGDAAAVKAFLAKGVDINTKTRYGATALAYACDKGHIEVVKLLIEHGADVNVRDTFYGATPIIWATQNGHTEIIRLLLDKGATGSKDQILMTGVEAENPGMVKLMLERGGVLPETLSLALSRANKVGNAEIIEMLKRAGATPPPKADFQVDPETLKSYAGGYKSKEGVEVIITFKDGKLMGGRKGSPELTLGAVDKTTFRPVDVDAITIVFNLEAGKVIGFTLKEPGSSSEFKKVE